MLPSHEVQPHELVLQDIALRIFRLGLPNFIKVIASVEQLLYGIVVGAERGGHGDQEFQLNLFGEYETECRSTQPLRCFLLEVVRHLQNTDRI